MDPITYCREVERKFVVENVGYGRAFLALLSLGAYETIIYQTSRDLYWAAPNVDFIRLRENSRELTVKVTDKGSIIDRIEENAVVEASSMDVMERVQTLLYGPPMKLVKEFSVFSYVYSPAPGVAFDVTLCLYQVQGDKEERLFFEVEADNITVVDALVSKVKLILTLKAESRSLYQIFKDVL
jgi:hypothetical protein